MRKLLWYIPLFVALSGCASPQRQAEPWEEDLPSEVFVPGSGDERCSIPGLIDWLEDRVPQHCCLVHDVAYCLGRNSRAPEHERAYADWILATCVLESRSEALARAVLIGVRVGGYSTWHHGDVTDGCSDGLWSE